MKKWISFVTICSILTSPFLCAEEIFYTDEDESIFNRGKFVGQENQDYLRAQQREKTKNWSIALGSTAIGIATLILVKQNHNKNR